MDAIEIDGILSVRASGTHRRFFELIEDQEYRTDMLDLRTAAGLGPAWHWRPEEIPEDVLDRWVHKGSLP